MPAIIARSISILSDAGLGMAMFSLGVWNVDIWYCIALCFCNSIPPVWLNSCRHLTVYSFRLVHGIAAANHCLREQTRCIRDGYSVPHGSSGHGCCLHSCRAARSSSAHSHCSGILQSCVTNWHTAHNWEKGSEFWIATQFYFRLLYLKESCLLCLPRSTTFILTYWAQRKIISWHSIVLSVPASNLPTINLQYSILMLIFLGLAMRILWSCFLLSF